MKIVVCRERKPQHLIYEAMDDGRFVPPVHLFPGDYVSEQYGEWFGYVRDRINLKRIKHPEISEA